LLCAVGPLRDPGLLALTVAHALGLFDNTGGLPSARLLDFVRHKWLLLVLDNFEHIAAAPPVPIFSPGDEHLHLSITGYAENDHSDGVQLASGSLTGAAMLSWDDGSLAGICCAKGADFHAAPRPLDALLPRQ